MKNSVKVVASAEGAVIRVSANNPEYGAIRVQETKMEINKGGFLQKKQTSALIKGKVEDLKLLGFRDGQEIGGQIVHEERTEPFYADQEPKKAGADGEVLTCGGAPIYRQSRWTSDMNAASTLLQHDTVTVAESIN